MQFAEFHDTGIGETGIKVGKFTQPAEQIGGVRFRLESHGEIAVRKHLEQRFRSAEQVGRFRQDCLARPQRRGDGQTSRPAMMRVPFASIRDQKTRVSDLRHGAWQSVRAPDLLCRWTNPPADLRAPDAPPPSDRASSLRALPVRVAWRRRQGVPPSGALEGVPRRIRFRRACSWAEDTETGNGRQPLNRPPHTIWKLARAISLVSMAWSPSRAAALARCIDACGDAESGRCAPVAAGSLDLLTSHFSPITSHRFRPPLTTKLRLLAVATATLWAACRFRQAQGPDLAEGRLAMSLRSIPRAKTALPSPLPLLSARPHQAVQVAGLHRGVGMRRFLLRHVNWLLTSERHVPCRPITSQF